MAPTQERSSEISEVVQAAAKSEVEQKQERAPPPVWLDKSFLQKALKQESEIYGGVEQHVDDVEVEYATAVGDNYCSCIFRARARLHDRPTSRSLLVKCFPEGDTFRRMVEETRLFEKESHMFAEIVPAMESLLEEAAPGRYPSFTARCLRHGLQPAHFIVLQDLCPEGFRLADRCEGMDLPHALVALKALGRFHGVSSALWRRRPELFEPMDNPFDGSFGTEGDPEDFLNVAADAIASWEDFPGDYDKKTAALKGKLFDAIKERNRIRPGKFNVLNHGDFWLNNMLFRHQGEDVSEVRFVDLQMSHVTNLAFDLIIFRYTSLQEVVFFDHWDTLLEAYQASMEETLHALGEEAPSLEDIHQDMHEARHFAIMAGFMWLPIVRLNTGKYDVEESLTKGAQSQSNVYRTDIFRHWIEKLLPIFEKEGAFDL